jgi:acyl-CoA dehydrogenase
VPDSDLAGLLADFFPATFPPSAVTAAETDGPPAAEWAAAAGLGLTLVGVAEEHGGSGGDLLDLIEVLRAAGEWAVPLPLAETGLAAWLLAAAGARVPRGPLAVIPPAAGLTLSGDRLTGDAGRVPWCRGATRVVAALIDDAGRPRVASIDPGDLSIRPGTDLAGMPHDYVTVRAGHVESWPGPDPDRLFLRGALYRAAQLAGAINGAFEITRRYVAERQQFGRPIGQFQAVQAHVVELAQAAAITALAAERAARAAMTGPAAFEILAAKSVATRHAGLAARAAHQAHGAIGMTREYRLQHLTRRLHTWSREFGSEAAVNTRLGAALAGSRGLMAAATSVASTVPVPATVPDGTTIGA